MKAEVEVYVSNGWHKTCVTWVDRPDLKLNDTVRPGIMFVKYL